MYDIRQFKPTLYVLVMMGIIGFALAAQAPALFLLAGGAVVANAWLVATNRFTPMPRLLANCITLIAFLFVAQQVVVLQTTPIIIVGQFLVLLQVVKLYEQRLNRDYAQLLVLSLLLMVAASINTASLLFGVLLIAYLFLSLYCCLLFHLKVETDHARAAYALPEDKINPSVLRQDQRYLSQSMRRLTGLVSGVAILMAIVVFLIFPRGTGANLLGPLQIKPSQSLTGFSDQMNFEQIANITQNTQTVGWVQVWKNNAPYNTGGLYLRGTTLDTYEGDETTGWRWSRGGSGGGGGGGFFGFGGGGFGSSVGTPGGSTPMQTLNPGERLAIDRPLPAGAPIFKQSFTLLPTNTPTLFTMPFPVEFTPKKRGIRARYIERTNTLVAAEPQLQKIEYDVVSCESFEPMTPTAIRAKRDRGRREFQSRIDPRIPKYLADEIDLGDLLARRDQGEDAKVGWAPHALDAEIARKIEQHLQSKFNYTLDLTEFGRTHGDDPIVRFLTEFKRGHCEYFAGAMTLLCQSLNIRARVVIGFRSDEVSGDNVYTIRQSHAHAWVEVQTPNGWITFDPTSGRAFNEARAGLMQRLRSMMNFMEFTWATSVIAYDNENRENLITNVNTRLDQTAVNSWPRVQALIQWIQGKFEIFASRVVGPIMVLLVVGMLFSVCWFLWERWRLRRRAERIGLDILPTTDQLRLVRQLGFYDDLLRLLERHNMTRPPHQTPLEFADSLAFLPSETYDTVRRLTQIFYKIRFGRMKLTGPQQRRLHTVLHRLAHNLGPVPQPTGQP